MVFKISLSRPDDELKGSEVEMAMEAMKMEHAIKAPRDEIRYGSTT